jgi:hypothetical protein
LYERASKQLDCYVAFISKTLGSQEAEKAFGGMQKWFMDHECLLRLIDSLMDFVICHSPLVFLTPDFSQDQLVPVLDDEFVDDDGNVIEGVVGYVPLNPADLAALPALRQRRNCWRRRP